MAVDPQGLKQLFLDVSELPPAERAAFLDRECGADAELRQRVEALLRAHDDSGGFLAPAAGPAVTADADPRRAASGPGSGGEAVDRVIGPYQLLQKLGDGGMGAVWVADQRQPVRRRVALKVIKPGMDSAQVVRRFEAERQALALMDHTHIARVLDAGTTAEGRPYFVMELVHGVPITKYCDELNLPVRERLELFVPVCRAIQHAHTKGVIHRDIKPSNVLVCMQDGRPVAKVIDFGVAKALHRPLGEATLVTEFGAVVGTLEYMAPEQAEVSPLGVDTRADVYALGVLLYELLTGTTPLDKKRLKRAALGEVLRIIREEEPPRPSTRLTESKEALASVAAQRRTDPGRLTKEVRGELDWIVMRCLEKDRTRRYETVSGLAHDVERYLAGEAVEACPPSAAYRLRKFARRHRAALAAAAAFAVLLASGTAVSAWQAVRATRAEAAALAERDEKEQARREAVDNEQRAREAAEAERAAKQEAVRAASAAKAARDAEAEQRRQAVAERNRAVRAEQEAKELAAIATAVNAFLQQDLLRQADSTEQADRGFTAEPKLTVREALDRAAAKIGDRFKDQPLVEAGVRQAIGDAYRGIGEAQLGVLHLKRSRALRQEALGPDHAVTLVTMNNLATAYWDAGRLDQALPLLEQALAKCKDKLGPDHPVTLASMNSLAVMYQDAGLPDRAVPLLEQILAKRQEKLGPEDSLTLMSMNNLAVAYADAGRLDRALPLLQQALAKQKEKLGPDHPRTLNTMNSLALTYKYAGRLDQAVPLYEQALAKRREKQGPDHPDTLTSMNNLAATYQDAGRLDEALPLHEQALAKRREKLGPEHPDTLQSMNNLALAYQGAGQFDKALPLVEQALAKCREKLGPDHPLTLITMNNLAGLYQSDGRLEKAVPLFEQALARLKGKFGSEHPSTLTTMHNLGHAYLFARQPGKAVPLLRSSLDGQKKQLGADNPRLAGAQDDVAWELLKAGQAADAEPILRESLAIRQKQEPDAWTTFNTRSLLGSALLGQKKYAEAERLLKAGYDGLSRRQGMIPPQNKVRLAEALERLVQLYEATGRPDEAARWRQELKAARQANKP
jgi:serine/threonine protein kinase